MFLTHPGTPWSDVDSDPLEDIRRFKAAKREKPGHPYEYILSDEDRDLFYGGYYKG